MPVDLVVVLKLDTSFVFVDFSCDEVFDKEVEMWAEAAKMRDEVFKM